jgi:hypothetical protein
VTDQTPALASSSPYLSFRNVARVSPKAIAGALADPESLRRLPDAEYKRFCESVLYVVAVTTEIERLGVPATKRKGERPNYLYAIAAEGTGFVKLGIAVDVDARLKSLQCSSPSKLHLLASRIGTYADERTLHERFGEYRAEGEWFRNEGALADFLTEWQAA